MNRLLIVPAAGRGSRLGAPGPKALVVVAGRTMLDHVLTMHGPSVDRAVVVVAREALAAFRALPAAGTVPIDLVVQAEPTGMLDAIAAASPIAAAHCPRRIVVTWCDQIAVTPDTLRRLVQRVLTDPAPALVFPTVTVDQPYIHFDRNTAGRIVRVRQRREGDAMPEKGETDLGVFDLSRETYLSDLPEFARSTLASAGTGERNFLPFIPWLASRGAVETIAGSLPIEAVGINTPAELAAVEAHLARQTAVNR